MTLEDPLEIKSFIDFSIEDVSHHWDRLWHDRIPLIPKRTITLIRDALWPYVNSLGQGQAILDLAAGADNAVYYPSCFDMSIVTALDASPVALALNPSGHKKLADFRAPLEYQDNTFDAVVCIFGMRYVRHQERLVQECLRVSKPDSWDVFIDLQDALEEPTAVREFDALRLQRYAQSLDHPTFVKTLRARTEHEYQLDLLAIRK